MKTIEEINAIKAKMQAQLNMRSSIDNAGDTRIVVGMATCGIAAGARPVLNAFVEEITKRNLKNVKVTQSGCLGMCKLEPMVEVYVPGKEKVTYVKVTADSARRIVAEHIVNGNPVLDFVIGNE
ncbi:MAG: (2Fe-2S) ferredoxin domain-containing protein [Clostridiales bacterium]|jgi:NADP-reducing hydrogenase subunit HndB|nr:(2Fe-2S) ferredoxin domain-containing protein [Clostridiales bacterium]HOB63929.1 (2Fe-2S) ferredoxin domain-containing protein [Clostridia bacterium]HOK81625.1 (2Fe-2S) ferredoxin domain-containing protein [Clostridia bacterium]HOL60522.1 (2Fe-2S) ferredoxin domain-containing protein [Clostridia bacterium]HPO52929.1 (2Fe-2S) ferredoxin domain-containing protein [Clostridia bacterium]